MRHSVAIVYIAVIIFLAMTQTVADLRVFLCSDLVMGGGGLCLTIGSFILCLLHSLFRIELLGCVRCIDLQVNHHPLGSLVRTLL